MGRGRSGRIGIVGASTRVSRSASTHPKVTDINQFGENLNGDQRRDWLMNHLGVSESEAQQGQKTIYHFTGGGFGDMHKDIDKAGNDVIDSIIGNPNSPVFDGIQFRGLSIEPGDMVAGVTPRQFIENIINGGVWREQGATSFSATRSVADDFAGWHSTGDHVSMVLIYENGTTGMPIKHMSMFSYEDEVLHSRQQMKNGYNITGHQWLDDRHVVVRIADRR